MNPRVRETGLGASHRFIVSTTVQLRSSKGSALLMSCHVEEAKEGTLPSGAGPNGRRRRMAVEIGRGRVACLRRSGDRGFEGNSSSEAETAFDSM